VQTIFDDLLAAFRTVLSGMDSWLVRDAIDRIEWQMSPRTLEAKTLPCLRHLDEINEIAADFARPLVALLCEHPDVLCWGQTYTEKDFSKAFLDNYGWLELFGTRGHFVNEDAAAGLLILGPRILYPDHHHLAEEIYVPLTGGAFWRMGEGPFTMRDAGEVVHHRSNVNHAMRTGDRPLLALYIWRGGPLAAKSTLTGEPAQ